MQTARQATQGYEDVIVLYGDVPLIRPETIRRLRDFHLEQRAAMTVLTATPKDLQGYGRVVRKSSSSDEIREIVEPKALNPEHAQGYGDQRGNLCLCHQAAVWPYRQPGHG